MGKYRVPVFFKSAVKESLWEQGFVDNGRMKIELKSDDQLSKETLKAHEKNQSVNSLGYENQGKV